MLKITFFLSDPEVDAAATMLTLKNGPNATIQSNKPFNFIILFLIFAVNSSVIWTHSCLKQV